MPDSGSNSALTSSFHALRGRRLEAVRVPAGLDPRPSCLFCSSPLTDAGAPESTPIAYTADQKTWVCMTCFCEHKDDFDWPTSEADDLR